MLALWLVIAAGLIAVGLGVDNRLSPSVVVVPGTESSHAATLAQQEFGPSVLVPTHSWRSTAASKRRRRWTAI